MLRDQFAKVLDEFGDMLQEDIYLSDDNTSTFIVDNEVVININYLEQSDSILMFSPVGDLVDDEASGQKAIELLKLNDIGNVAGRVTLMMDPQNNLILAADHQSALTITSKEVLADWVDNFVHAVRSTRDYFAEHYPVEE